MMKKVYLSLILLAVACQASAVHSDHRNRKIDSMEVVLQRGDASWEDQLRAHKELMWGYLQTDGKQSIFHAKEILRKTEGATDKGLMTRLDAFRILGQHAYAKGLYDSARHCYDHALETTLLAQKSKRYNEDDIDNTYAALYGTFGNLYNIQGMVTLATEYYYKALPYMERQNWREGISTLYYNIGEMFSEMGNNAEARKAYEKALEAALATGDSLIIASPRYGLATVLLNEGKPQEALSEELKSIEYLRHHAKEEEGGLMDGLVLLARIYWQGLGDMPKAQQQLDEALQIARHMETVTNVSDAYFTQGELCLARKEWRQAAHWSRLALSVNDQDPHHNIPVYKTLSEAYAHLQQPDSVTHYISLMHQTMEEMANDRHQSAIGEMQVRYETLQKEARITQLANEQRRFIIVASIIGSLVVLLIAVTWRFNRQRRKALAVEAKLSGEREERQRLGRDLHDRIGGMLTALRLSIEHDQKDEALQRLQQTNTELRKVAHHLMPDSLKRQGLDVALHDYCHALPGVSFSCLGTPRRLNETAEVLCYSAVHELINNALRHSGATEIIVQLMFEADSLSAIVADNGCGFDPDKVQEGMGLRNIRERLAATGGRMSISSHPDNGTEIQLNIKA